MKFKVMAGNMFCGYLGTFDDCMDVFLNCSGHLYEGVKILRYKHLKLVRVS